MCERLRWRAGGGRVRAERLEQDESNIIIPSASSKWTNYIPHVD